ncbi:PREDICTED: NKG2-A/NKG2-B type II integral membrane protein-like [Elephantulus edwardii]|uniref:NKG2-A/NKG2-B type II integral membrane protein-like n=1 Tax=Elephantulus edwardii TaxID=28737 RepID=UPI0003F0A981|nr:PREDICTED: NKG2-A/NKG2-B type II integral membrane protein-like [Elephantulus edwardii]
MSNQRVTYAEINLAKYPKQKLKPKSKSSLISNNEKEITYVELNLHNAPQSFHANNKKFHNKDFPSHAGRLLSGILGIICLVLMASVITVGVTVINRSKAKQVEHNNSSLTTKSLTGHSCDHCPKDWLLYSNNCYYINTDRKTWNESWMSCVSKNSNLLYIEDDEEMGEQVKGMKKSSRDQMLQGSGIGWHNLRAEELTLRAGSPRAEHSPPWGPRTAHPGAKNGWLAHSPTKVLLPQVQTPCLTEDHVARDSIPDSSSTTFTLQ